MIKSPVRSVSCRREGPIAFMAFSAALVFGYAVYGGELRHNGGYGDDYATLLRRSMQGTMPTTVTPDGRAV